MLKPSKIKREYYDYNECREYLQEKYNFNEEDILERHKHNQRYEEKTNDIRPPYAKARFIDPKTNDKRVYHYKLSLDGKTPLETETLDKITDYYVGDKKVTAEEAYAADYLVHQWFERYEAWKLINPEPEYLNFRYFIYGDGTNDGTVSLSVDSLIWWEENPSDAPDKGIIEIYKKYIEEFADEDGELIMWVDC